MPKGVSRWADASNGPDWTDIRATMGAIGAIHECTVSILMRPSGGTNDSLIELSVVATQIRVLPYNKVKSLVSERKWPNTLGQSLVQAVYYLLLDIDLRASNEWYAQTLF